MKGAKEMINKFIDWYFDGNAWLWIVVLFVGILLGKYFT